MGRSSNRKPLKSSPFLKRGRHRASDKYSNDEYSGEDEDEPSIYELDEDDNAAGENSDSPPPEDKTNLIKKEFTRAPKGRALVALSSTVMSILISSFLSMMLFSSIWWGVVKASGVLFFTAAFTQSILGNLSRSLGVFLLLLLKQSWVKSILNDIFVLVG